MAGGTGGPLSSSGNLLGIPETHLPEDPAVAALEQGQDARTVAAAYPGAKLKVDPQLTKGATRLVIGAGADPAREVPNREGTDPLPSHSVTAPPAPTAVKSRTADQDICG